MINDATRRRELHDFLQAARARLEPADLGLTVAPNRRGSGLHQSDVAAALAVSGRWYNGLENGTGQSTPGSGVLDRLAVLLRLTRAERVRLYLLAAGHDPAPATIEAPDQDPGSRAALERLVGLAGPDLPALLCDVAWNMLAWNDALSGRVFDPAALPAGDRNPILWLFTSAAAHVVTDIGAVREEEIGRVHLALARYPGDPQLGDLAARLQQIPSARLLWNRQHVPGPVRIAPRHIRSRGAAAATGSDLVSAEFPGRLRLLILVPHGDWPPGPAPPGPRHPAFGLASECRRSPAGADPVLPSPRDEPQRQIPTGPHHESATWPGIPLSSGVITGSSAPLPAS